MPNLEEFVHFNPEKDIPSLEGKVIFITGGKPPSPLYLMKNIADTPKELPVWGKFQFWVLPNIILLTSTSTAETLKLENLWFPRFKMPIHRSE